jgi:hypothetical protein
MTSEKQLEANRLNSQKSTGPRTGEGKGRSRLNAMRHGLTGQVSVLSEEDRQAHFDFTMPIVEGYNPQTPHERQLAQSIAEDEWRINRMKAVEDNIYGMDHPDRRDPIRLHPQLETAYARAQTFVRQQKAIQLLSLYLQRTQRAIERNVALLQRLQAERRAAFEQAMEEEQLLIQLAVEENRTYAPKPQNGFVFSMTELVAAIERKQHLERARTRFKTAKRPEPNLKKAA